MTITTTRKRAPFLKAGSFAILRMLQDEPEGMTVRGVANFRNIHITDARASLIRMESMGAVRHEARKRDDGHTVFFYMVTDKGRQLLDQFIERERTVKATKPSAESEDDADTPWPRRDPDEVVRQAVKTQPVSVFDMARMIACEPA